MRMLASLVCGLALKHIGCRLSGGRRGLQSASDIKHSHKQSRSPDSGRYAGLGDMAGIWSAPHNAMIRSGIRLAFQGRHA